VELANMDQESDVKQFLSALVEDRLVKIEKHRLKITESGKPFLRNACMALDARLRAQKPDARVFSQSL
jgi:oxygen-independent coproporphyrinogen-3 oxidase